jgi:hypothetical protein
VKALFCLSVCLPPAALRAGRRRVARIRTPGVSLRDSWLVRIPRCASPAGLQLSTAPPRHRPVPSLRAPATFSRAREGACEPGAATRQPFPQGPQARVALGAAARGRLPLKIAKG